MEKIMKTKRCGRCKLEKNVLEFHKCNATKDGLQAYCKVCRSFSNVKYRTEDTEELMLVEAVKNAKEDLADYREKRIVEKAIEGIIIAEALKGYRQQKLKYTDEKSSI